MKWKATRARPIDAGVDGKITRHFYEVRMFNVSVQRVHTKIPGKVHTLISVISKADRLSYFAVTIFNASSPDPRDDLPDFSNLFVKT